MACIAAFGRDLSYKVSENPQAFFSKIAGDETSPQNYCLNDNLSASISWFYSNKDTFPA